MELLETAKYYKSELGKRRGAELYWFMHLLIVKGKLDRLGRDTSFLEIEKEAREVGDSSILKYHKKNGFSKEFMDRIGDVVVSVSDNAHLFARDRITEQEKEELKGYGLDIKEESEEERETAIDKIENACLLLILEMETHCLIHKEVCSLFKVVLPRLEKRKKECIKYFDSLYIPPSVEKTLKEYIRKNKVNTGDMTFFLRKTIQEIPILIPVEIQRWMEKSD
jgi:hypothetical protein